MLKLYTLIFNLILPFVLLRLFCRGVKIPEYRQRWQERLGIYQTKPCNIKIWLHAVSVGEAETAFLLIKQLQTSHPDINILVTTTTPTGSARVSTVLGDSVEHVYLPYDLPKIVDRFLAHFQPEIAVIMEKEIWPNLFAACASRQIPIFIINARLSARSARAYLKIPGLVKPTLMNVELIATQTADDKTRFIEIGTNPEKVQVLGNIKFDIKIDNRVFAAGQALKNSLFAERFVWIIGSSHQGEETVFLKLYSALKTHIPSLLLLMAPRHPERFKTVKHLCENHGLSVVMRSETQKIEQFCDVYIADSIGELRMLYAAADVAFVAGSLSPVGGHNVLEPAAVGTPVLFGPHMHNFQEIADNMLNADAAILCSDETAISQAILRLYTETDFRHAMGAKAKAFVEKNRGATSRIARLLENCL